MEYIINKIKEILNQPVPNSVDGFISWHNETKASLTRLINPIGEPDKTDFDPTYAPEGYFAAKGGGMDECLKCVFHYRSECKELLKFCSRYNRPDGIEAYLVRKNK